MWDDFLLFVAVGFVAQIIDGAAGMAYGVTATTALLSVGVPPAIASACTHTAEVFTTGASGYSHWRFRNIDMTLVKRLAIPGMVGGAVGVFVLTSVPGEAFRPIISAYLLLMGVLIILKAIKPKQAAPEELKKVPLLGLVGGFFDAVGGGGWGPMVTSTLIGRGATPRYAIGSVSLSEFFVTVTITGTFIFTIGLDLWPYIIALVVGGVLAAPLAAFATKRIPDQPMMMVVGTVIIILSVRELVRVLT
jgi:uncharacterized membrane protein YfcA